MINHRLKSPKNLALFTVLILINFIWIYLTVLGILKPLDETIHVWAMGQRIPWLNPAIEALTEQSGIFGIILFFPVLIYLNKHITGHYINKNDKVIILISSIYLLTAVSMKYVYHLPRPPIKDMLNLESSFSFPSGHTAVAFTMISNAYYFVTKWFNIDKQQLRFFCVIFLFLIAYTRLYLGVHWFTDVVGSILLGTSYFQLARIMIRKLN